MIVYDICTDSVEQTLQTADLFVKNFLLNSVEPNINKNIDQPIIIYLIGDLGTGKTTFMRGLVASFGFTGSVKSPTYTIVEPYLSLTVPIYHFDLYRLEQPMELELMGIRDYLQSKAICCFEWPDKGKGYIPEPDFIIELSILNDYSRQICISKILTQTYTERS